MTDDRQTDHVTEKCVAIGEIAFSGAAYMIGLIIMMMNHEGKNKIRYLL